MSFKSENIFSGIVSHTGQYAQAPPQPMPVMQQPSYSENAPLLGNQSQAGYGGSAPSAPPAQVR